jgi:hypothetical protein
MLTSQWLKTAAAGSSTPLLLPQLRANQVLRVDVAVGIWDIVLAVTSTTVAGNADALPGADEWPARQQQQLGPPVATGALEEESWAASGSAETRPN